LILHGSWPGRQADRQTGRLSAGQRGEAGRLGIIGLLAVSPLRRRTPNFSNPLHFLPLDGWTVEGLLGSGRDGGPPRPDGYSRRPDVPMIMRPCACMLLHLITAARRCRADTCPSAGMHVHADCIKSGSSVFLALILLCMAMARRLGAAAHPKSTTTQLQQVAESQVTCCRRPPPSCSCRWARGVWYSCRACTPWR
jgi:hypothetical protein